MTRRKLLKGIVGGVAALGLPVFGLTFHAFPELGHPPDPHDYALYKNLSYFADGKFHGEISDLPYYPDRVIGGGPGWLRFLLSNTNMPKFTLPVNKLTHTSFPEIPSKFAACWLGHSTLIIELDGKRLLVDPVFGNAAPVPGIVRRYEESPLKREDLPCIDYVLITHDHYDHLEYPTIKFLREKRETHFIVPLGVDSHLLEWGIPPARIHPLGWGKTYTGGLDVTSEPTVHFSGRTFGSRNSTLWTSYVIRGKSQRIYISGDTGYGPHFSESGEKHGPFDAAFIEIDGWNPGWPKTHLFPKEVIKACRQLKAQALIPVHWGVFDLALHPWDESITILADLAAQTENINLQTPLLGEIFVPGETSTRKWWL